MQKEMDWIENAIDALAVTARRNDEYWRASYTREDAAGAALLEKWMSEKGFQTRYDAVGNLYGRVEGLSEETILIGSHRDTVKNGGKFDGALGILVGIEAAASLLQEKGKPQKSVEVAALCEEEASRFLTGYVGSRAIVGELERKNLEELDADGMTLAEAMVESGYYQGELPPARSDVSQFLELHIEQGAVLENRQKKVGIVTAIVGLFAGEISFFGEQNHAGTTPMSQRKDPVPTAAAFIQQFDHWAKEKADQITCTFGNIVVEPGKSNVIADKVIVTFDIRSGSRDLLREAEIKINSILAKQGNVNTKICIACQDPPVDMNEEGIILLQHLAEEKNLSYLKMSSGAGHDSQIIAPKIRTNMIFVPSRGGISHSPLEYTDLDDLRQGYTLMKAYIEAVAWQQEKGENDEIRS